MWCSMIYLAIYLIPRFNFTQDKLKYEIKWTKKYKEPIQESKKMKEKKKLYNNFYIYLIITFDLHPIYPNNLSLDLH